MTEQEKLEIVDHAAEMAVEALKFAPENIDIYLQKVQEKIAAADMTAKPNVVKIVHKAANIGQIAAAYTESTKDDTFFAKVDQILDNYEENGEKTILAILQAIFSKIAKKG